MSIFDTIKLPKLKRNAFNLSFESKLTTNMGVLTPILCQEVLPGDTFKVNSELLIKMPAMFAPIMQRIDAYVHYFFVPNRLVWEDWQDFITAGINGTDAPLYPTFRISPNMMIGKWSSMSEALYPDGVGSLSDYLGFPVTEFNYKAPIELDALPFRAYNLIYQNYYMDQNIDGELEPDLDISSGVTAISSQEDANHTINLKLRCWEKDYFTSALPWTQRGNEVKIPISGDVDIESTDFASLVRDSDISMNGSRIINADGQPAGTSALQVNNGTLKSEQGTALRVKAENYMVWLPELASKLKGTYTNLTSTINDLRQAYSLQRWLERNAVGGSRYTEQLLSHFGVRSSDARLQRPEYLGGGKQPIMISEVVQQSQSQENGDNPSAMGDRAGIGYGVGRSNSFKRFFEEHGMILGILSVRPRTSYQQGLPRKFSRRTYLDYYFPEFAHLGEQPILNKEIYYKSSEPDGVFGYQSRFAEYKTNQNEVHGDFRTNLDYWHLGRIFANEPHLNYDFIHVPSTAANRAMAVSADKTRQLYISIYNNIKALRPMPKFATPRL